MNPVRVVFISRWELPVILVSDHLFSFFDRVCGNDRDGGGNVWPLVCEAGSVERVPFSHATWSVDYHIIIGLLLV